MPTDLKAGCWGLSPSDTKNNISPTDLFHPPSPSRPPNPSIMPFLVPALMTLASAVVVQAYRNLTIQAQDIID